jgi:hypothetical protein
VDATAAPVTGKLTAFWVKYSNKNNILPLTEMDNRLKMKKKKFGFHKTVPVGGGGGTPLPQGIIYQDKDLSCHFRFYIVYIEKNGGQTITGIGFSLRPSFFPFSIIPSIFHICLLFAYQKSYVTFTIFITVDHNTSPVLQVPMSTTLW